MIRSVQLETQLAAYAAAVDRANRPLSLLTIPAVILIAALLFVAWSYRGMAQQKQLLALRTIQTKDVAQMVAAIQAEKDKGVDLGSLYSAMPFFDVQMEEAWISKSALSFTTPPQISGVQSSSIIAATPKSKALNRSEITVTVNNEALPTILAGINSALNHEILRGRAFLSWFQMSPAATGWNWSMKFALYETK